MNTQHSRPRGRSTAPRAGFSLAELMVVVVILGLLATLVMPRVLRHLVDARRAKARSDITAMNQALKDYWINNSHYPDSLQELVENDENGNRYLEQLSVPEDPWGFEYLYERPGPGESDPRVYTLGADNLPGGEGEDADISNLLLLGAKEG